MELQNRRVNGVREQARVDKTNNNTLASASGKLMAMRACLAPAGPRYQGLNKGSTAYLASGNGRSMLKNVPFRGPEHPLRCW